MRRPVALALLSVLAGCTLTGTGVSKSERREVGSFDTIVLSDIVDVHVREGVPQGTLEVHCDEGVIDHLETRVSGGILTVGFGGAGVSVSTVCEVVTGHFGVVELISEGLGELTVEGPAWSLGSIRAESVGSIRVDLRSGVEDSAALTEGEASVDVETSMDVETSARVDALFIEVLDIGGVEVTGVDAASVEVWTESNGDVSLAGSAELLSIDSSGLGDVRARELEALEALVFASSAADITVTATQRVVIEHTGIGDIVVYGDPADRSVTNDSVGSIAFR